MRDDDDDNGEEQAHNDKGRKTRQKMLNIEGNTKTRRRLVCMRAREDDAPVGRTFLRIRQV